MLVAVDKFKSDKSSKTSATFSKEDSPKEFEEDEEVIIGVAIWAIEEGSKRVRQFQGGIGAFLLV